MSGHIHASSMLHILSGLLSLLLDLALISGQTADISLIISEDVVKNGVNMLQNASHIPGVNGKFFEENIKDNVTFEDQEDFQDQEKIHHYGQCNETLLRHFGKEICSDHFDLFMSVLGEENWCNWEMVLNSYHDLTYCLEQVCAVVAHCYYPNAVVQEMFVEVHKQYFSLCGTKEEVLPDAPARVVLVLTLLPVSVIPILVYMVIWKSSVID
ncbi:hypothetical protein Q7C36_007287 [Tachysurus vachellii]|uniref:Uncharacterized protein n=1 Tax=Tachysurus vachellii TaxID=175792 RepID=A0AA88NBT5_TACVA|nr:hypothetical protein Q7C36_007287 [Tachysurus vachellii]